MILFTIRELYICALFRRSFLIEEKCRFLSNFSLKTAEVELPGEFLIPRVRESNFSKLKSSIFNERIDIIIYTHNIFF